MEHFRLRKYRGPEVWARVREAYVAGEPGPQVARRFDVGLANLRKKASREGWTRNKAAEANDPLILATQPHRLGEPQADALPTAPADALADAIQKAAALLAAGRAAEATALLKAAETLGRVAGPEAAGAPTINWADDPEIFAIVRDQVGWRLEQKAAFEAEFGATAIRLAEAMLRDHITGAFPDAWALAAFHWRARNLGPELALADFARAVQDGWATHFWDAEGSLHPLPEAGQPEDRMIRQHLGCYQGVDHTKADTSGWTWPPGDRTTTAPPPDRQPAKAPPVVRRL